jgi:hypothetical protein
MSAARDLEVVFESGDGSHRARESRVVTSLGDDPHRPRLDLASASGTPIPIALGPSRGRAGVPVASGIAAAGRSKDNRRRAKGEDAR